MTDDLDYTDSERQELQELRDQADRLTSQLAGVRARAAEIAERRQARLHNQPWSEGLARLERHRQYEEEMRQDALERQAQAQAERDRENPPFDPELAREKARAKAREVGGFRV